ncbi:MAG: HPr family phosphocarrier protein [Deltaproteobacteria bacterium]|jgi:phosphocarrier protein HPr|nr:HPr family phosphocarrier protein [Deltaproteobacteria bacterium]
MKDRMTRDVAVVNDLGLHARSAAKIAELVRGANAGVWLIRDGERADATSIIDLLGLACPKGTLITVAVEDERDHDILEAVVDLVASGFGE